MCAGCVMSAMAGATGLRSWLQTHNMSWLTPERLKRITIALFVVAFALSSVMIGGSAVPVAHAAAHARHR
jgi:hypothetical protein